MGILGGVASAASKALTHALTFGLTGMLLSNIAQFVWHKRKPVAAVAARRRSRGKKALSHFGVWGPAYLTALAVPLVMADLTRHVLQDANMWLPACDISYNPPKWHNETAADKAAFKAACEAYGNGKECVYSPNHGKPECDGVSFWHPGSSMYYTAHDKLSIIGVVFTVILTWSGFISLTIGVIWSANLHHRVADIKKQWAILRGTA